MSKKVAILGGGIAGLTAAQELAERDFEVDVYEKRSIFGGKARSVEVPDSATDGRDPLPGEHGFRFFPNFYKHVFDTMENIPYADNENGVLDNLVETTHWMFARRGDPEVALPLNISTDLDDWLTLYDVLLGDELDIPDEESRFFVSRILTFLTSCQKRRDEEYDQISWWDFIEAERMSDNYQEFHAVGLTRGLVALEPRDGSTRTVGTIYVQMLLGLLLTWLHVDSVLDGPTNDVWIDPWVDHLDQKGVTLHPETRVESLDYHDGRIVSATVSDGSETRTISADYFIAALPVEVMTELVTEEIAEAAPDLADIDELETAWMNGIQFYFDENVPVNQGHVIYAESPWALTSVTQQLFWEDIDFADYGDGDVDSILSLCISDWNTPGEVVEKPAKECTPEEIKEEVWAQLVHRLNDDEQAELENATIVDWFLDPDIEHPSPNETTNAEPLLINTVGSRKHRPEADTSIRNLFLASDYVRTHTDLATMEGANEAARRAVNAILADGSPDADRCEIWPLEEPSIFEPWKTYDRIRYELGLPHHSLA